MSDVAASPESLAAFIAQRLRQLGLSARKASLQAELSHNTLRVVLAGARPTPETCAALEPVLELPSGLLRLMAGWPMDAQHYVYAEDWARFLLDLSTPEDRQRVISFLLAQRAHQ